MAFHEARLVACVAMGTKGATRRSTQISALASGHEERNMRWQDSRRSYELDLGRLRNDEIEQFVAFFEARGGSAHAFRFKDPSDHKSALPSAPITPSDQLIGTGDGARVSFQLVKRYLSALEEYRRPITKPVPGSVRVAVNGVETSSAVIDHTTGIVKILPAPASGASVTAGFEFDVPVRFDGDEIEAELETSREQSLGRVRLIEVRDIEVTEPAYVLGVNGVPHELERFTLITRRLADLARGQ